TDACIDYPGAEYRTHHEAASYVLVLIPEAIRVHENLVARVIAYVKPNHGTPACRLSPSDVEFFLVNEYCGEEGYSLELVQSEASDRSGRNTKQLFSRE